jgi:hypothetical protein
MRFLADHENRDRILFQRKVRLEDLFLQGVSVEMRTEITRSCNMPIRSGRVLILLANFLFFALLTPVMLKVVLPMVLSVSLPEEVRRASAD